MGDYLRSGLTRNVNWQGSVDLHYPQGTPVKLNIHSYHTEDHGPWILLKDNEYIQGCVVVGEGVYGVMIEGVPRVICAVF